MRHISFFLLSLLLACARSGPSTAAKEGTGAKKPTESKNTPAPAAQEPSKISKEGIQVSEAQVCRSITDRNPQGDATTFPTDIGRLYLFTKVVLTQPAETAIKHVWYFADKEVATVTLPIRNSLWRTYSSKAIDPASKGSWKVEIKSPSDELLKTVSFQIQ